jgi:hypothetical protein
MGNTRVYRWSVEDGGYEKYAVKGQPWSIKASLHHHAGHTNVHFDGRYVYVLRGGSTEIRGKLGRMIVEGLTQSVKIEKEAGT